MNAQYTFPYTHDDVMQALSCQALFPDSGMATAALELWQDHRAGRDSDRGWVSGDTAHLVGGSYEVKITLAALRLLAQAGSEANTRGVALRGVGGHTLYDLRGMGFDE